MNRSYPRAWRIPFALSLSTTMLLAACGGGSGTDTNTSTTDANAAVAARDALPLGSPGYLIPANQSNLSVTLSNCNLTENGSTTNTGDGTLTLGADGTAVFTARSTVQGSPQEVVRITLADATSRLIRANTTSTGTTAADVNVTYHLALGTTRAELDVRSSNNTVGRLDVLLPSREFTCDVPANAFSLPENVSGQRLAQLTEGTTASDVNLLNPDNLSVDANSTTWHTAAGLPYDELDRFSTAYRFARFVRLGQTTPGNPSSVTVAVSESLNGTYVPIEVAPRQPGTVPYTAEYTESYRLPRRGGAAEIAVTSQLDQATPTASTPSHYIRFARQGNTFYPGTTLQTVPLAYSGLGGAPDGTPNMFFQTNRRLALSNCSNGTPSNLQRSILFDDIGRVLWLDGQGNVLAQFIPSDTAFQERTLGLSNNAVRSEFKVYATAFDQTRDNRLASLTLHTGNNNVTVTYGNTSESCNAPPVQNPPAQNLNARFNAFLNYGGQSFVDTNTSSYTCPGDNGPTSWTHRLNNTGELSTETTLPGGQPNRVQWSGGTGWFNEPGANYTETYTASGSNPASVASQLIHPATTVRQGCFSGLAITPINGVTALRSSP